MPRSSGFQSPKWEADHRLEDSSERGKKGRPQPLLEACSPPQEGAASVLVGRPHSPERQSDARSSEEASRVSLPGDAGAGRPGVVAKGGRRACRGLLAPPGRGGGGGWDFSSVPSSPFAGGRQPLPGCGGLPCPALTSSVQSSCRTPSSVMLPRGLSASAVLCPPDFPG